MRFGSWQGADRGAVALSALSGAGFLVLRGRDRAHGARPGGAPDRGRHRVLRGAVLRRRAEDPRERPVSAHRDGGAGRSSAGGRIVDGVDIGVEQGEWVTLIGPNGAGKTTLLRAIAGLARVAGPSRFTDISDRQPRSPRGARRSQSSRRCRDARWLTVARIRPPRTDAVHLGTLAREGRRDHAPSERRSARLDLD